MKRIGLVTVVLVVVATAPLPGSAHAGSTTTATASFTFHVVVPANFIDAPPREGMHVPPRIGDQFAFTSDVRSRAGGHAGRLQMTCTVAEGGVGASGPCYGNYLLAGGAIAVITVFRLGTDAPTHLAIVGGTGVYDGATGSVLSVPRSGSASTSDDTLRLLLP
jgi:hypothetical protein